MSSTQAIGSAWAPLPRRSSVRDWEVTVLSLRDSIVIWHLTRHFRAELSHSAASRLFWMELASCFSPAFLLRSVKPPI